MRRNITTDQAAAISKMSAFELSHDGGMNRSIRIKGETSGAHVIVKRGGVWQVDTSYLSLDSWWRTTTEHAVMHVESLVSA